VKNNLGILGKRRDMELNINVVNQDNSANSLVQEGGNKHSKVDGCDQISLNLTDPHGKAHQEQ
jgi:hypothetical protein